MAMRSLLRRVPSLAGRLGAPAAPASSPSLRPRSPTFQALQPAAGSRFLSQNPGPAVGRAVYSEETLRKEGDRVHAEIMQAMKELQQQTDEYWRLEIEFWAKLRKKLDTIEMACNVTILLCVPAIVVMLMKM